ncbi:lipid II flippase MurJ [Streptomyces sp. DSM 42041]|uniref:Lipid II flippase MurJ n=1 Tax=Streptomyces hazeniae TaxID=3075538 RepID=A0ABU2NTY3_9ACTN|nr:lipid II flippase MurJ [Streptomyces sp. DSM 42041]MDT0380430.1 lipid II flippase MurJ [Streptomyces sp. DSM 42041]
MAHTGTGTGPGARPLRDGASREAPGGPPPAPSGPTERPPDAPEPPGTRSLPDVPSAAGAASDDAVADGGRQGRFIARAAAATAALTVAGALMGLVRDQTIAHLYGAGAATDAFLVSWTVPEIAATLLIEDAMALVLIPAFSLALSRRAALRATRAARAAGEADGGGPDPVRALLTRSLPRLLLALACASGLLMAVAPGLVGTLAPGLADPELAVQCTRLTAVTLLTFGTAGYLSAGLRAHGRFVPPAAIYVAYNLGIVATVLVLHALWGVRAAALGVAVGGALMVLVQLPFFLRVMPRGKAGRRARLRAGRRERRGGRPEGAPGTGRATMMVGAGVLLPIALFTLGRQSQVLVERYLASSLPAGAISHLNYAQKVAQIPMALSLMICTVTFPLVARALADGEAETVRRRVERDLAGAALVVLLGAAYVFACAPQIIELLFQRGAFSAQDTEATASVMRVYALGLLGHSMVGAVVRPFFSTGRPTWYPACTMVAGLLVTIAGGVALSRLWGTHGIAAANAAGITLTAILLLAGTGSRSRRHVAVAVDLPRVLGGLVRLLAAAALAAAAGCAVAQLCGPALLAASAGALVVSAVFLVTGYVLGAGEIPQLVSAVERRLRHDR